MALNQGVINEVRGLFESGRSEADIANIINFLS